MCIMAFHFRPKQVYNTYESNLHNKHCIARPNKYIIQDDFAKIDLRNWHACMVDIRKQNIYTHKSSKVSANSIMGKDSLSNAW